MPASGDSFITLEDLVNHRRFIIRAAALISLTASVASAVGTWTPWGTVESLEYYQNGPSVMGLSLSSNPAGCANLSRAVPRSDLTPEAVERQARVLHTALVAGSDVSIKLDDGECSGGGTNGYPTYYGVRVRR